MIIMNGIRALFILNMGYLLWIGDRTNLIAVTMALVASFFPWIMRKILRIKTPLSFDLFGILFILLSQWAGTYLRAYDIFPWWDVFLHGISGILIGLFGIILIACFDKKGKLYEEKSYGLISLIIFLTSCSSATLWEISEYLGDLYLGTNAQLGSLPDTMEDMLICVVVGIVFALYHYYIFATKKDTYLSKEIEAFIKENKPKVKAIAS
ncbi:MAG: hypothetical protein RR744_05790 [Cellulosilyticaceae bacterium]